jgi:cytoskeleton protein RodZ
MSDERDKSNEQEPEAESTGPLGGERLAEARREQQISVLEVAKELHLDEPKVRALERNDFEMLGAPVFAKGHLRKYAQLVGVDPDDVFADYYQLTRSESLPPVVIAGRPKIRQELSPGPWIAVIVVIIVAAASYWWSAVESESNVQAPESGVIESDPVEQGNVEPEPDEQAVMITTVADDEPAVATADPVADEESPLPVDALPDGEIRISLSFSGDCWTEISDATGRRLFFEMGRNGRAVELTGQPPFAVLFGNVENVNVRVGGSDYPVAAANPGSRTARLTITGQ